MKNITFIFILVLSLLVINSCKEDDIDKEKPVIDLTIQEAFPVNCDTLYLGETFIMKIRFTDNAELGSYSIDIHNNFDHHSHSTEIEECDMEPVKEPVNPWVFIQDYDIPPGLSEYVTDLTITVPTAGNLGQYDDGDYHFYLSLTDAEGWSAQKGLSVKMVRK